MSNGIADSEGVRVQRHSPEAVFALLGDDIRVGILEALGQTPDEAVSFADLHRRVGLGDSGQFNYHLKKLRDAFVRRTDDGYELTHAGRQIVGAMHAGTYTADATVDPIPADADCPLCGGRILASYADETATLACEACDEWRNEFPFPPGSLDQFPVADLPVAFHRWMTHIVRGVVGGFCHTCAGRMRGRLVLDDPDGMFGNTPAHVVYTCDRCGSRARTSPQLPAQFHPAVQGFLYDNGVDTTRDPTWSVEGIVGPDLTLDSTDPPRLHIRFTGAEETLDVHMAADATVERVERRSLAEPHLGE